MDGIVHASPAVVFDASDLAATVERARALLDDGDVIAARVLAGRAYDEARAAVQLGERFKAGEMLIDKARRLQGDALLIEARAKVQMADHYDAAQSAGLVRKPGQRGKAVGDDDSISGAATADDVGLTRQEVHEARKLRDAERATPGLVERAIAARILAGLSPSRANLRAAVGTSTASAAERGDNFYETPAEATRALMALEGFGPVVWEPACGRGAIARLLDVDGRDLVLSDLVDRGCVNRHGECQETGDFLATARDERGVTGAWRGALSALAGDFDIVTNPPYGPLLNGFVAHALRVHRPRKMALLLNLNFLAGFDDDDRNFALDVERPARVYVFTRRLPMMHRDGWDGNEASSRMNTAWFVWERGADGSYGRRTLVERIDWKNFEGGAVGRDACDPSNGPSQLEAPRSVAPPSVLPDISPSGGEITLSAASPAVEWVERQPGVFDAQSGGRVVGGYELRGAGAEWWFAPEGLAIEGDLAGRVMAARVAIVSRWARHWLRGQA